MLLNCVVGDVRVPWTARRTNKSILKEISPEYSLEGLMLKLKLQYFGHLMGQTDSLEKTLMLGKIEGGRRGDEMRWGDGITHSVNMSLSRLWELVMEREAWCAAVHGIGKSRTRQSDWTDFLLLTKTGHWMDLLLTYHTWVAYEPSLFLFLSLRRWSDERQCLCFGGCSINRRA